MFTWIHNCPQRKSSVGETIASVEASDLRQYEVRLHPDHLTPAEIEEWWEDCLLDAAGRSPYFLRLEDDVLVGASIRHNILTWPALGEADFGVGCLMWLRGWGEPPADGRSPNFRKTTGPGQVWLSEHVPAIVEAMRAIRSEPGYQRFRRLDFDWIVALAVQRLGLRVYVHTPSLVDCTLENGISTCGPTFAGFFAHDFDPTWKRP